MREIPRYAILSHTWTDEEVTFQEFLSKDGDTVREKESKNGFIKIMKTCELATEDEIGYVWVDTCCIDKSSSAELSEAINSMWRYYKEAEVCYAYLSDLPSYLSGRANVVEKLKACKWFTRGWTLQELIAPKKLRFYDETWHFKGLKDKFAKPIHQITKIPPDVLRNPEGLAKLSIAERMTWASKRETTRIEDTAYCLLGIFDINMPLLYGEGNKAFIRLQQEIIRLNNDLSIFGWCPQDGEEPFIVPRLDTASAGACKDNCGHKVSDEHDFYSALAPSPKAFARPSRWDVVQSVEHSVTNRGIKIDCSLKPACLRGCSPYACMCCSHCRKYVLIIGHGGRNFYGIIMKKTGPDTFIRCKKQLINIFEYWQMQTRQRSIYFLTQTPFNSQDTFYGVSLDIIQCVAGELEVYEAMPESSWDFAKRRWYDKGWGIVDLGFQTQSNIGFKVLFFSIGHEVSILDSDLYDEETALRNSRLITEDVALVLSLGHSSRGQSEKDFHINRRTVRVKVDFRSKGFSFSLAVSTEGNISHSHVQLMLY